MLQINKDTYLPNKIVDNFQNTIFFLEYEFMANELFSKLNIFFEVNTIDKLKIERIELFENYSKSIKIEKEIRVSELGDFFTKTNVNGFDMHIMLDNIILVNDDYDFAISYFKRDDVVLVFLNSKKKFDSFNEIVLPYKELSLHEKLIDYLQLFENKEEGQIFINKLSRTFF